MTKPDTTDKVLAIAGTLIPIGVFAYAFFKEKPSSVKEGLISVNQRAFDNPVTAALLMDLIVSSIAFNREVKKDIKAKKVKGPFILYFLMNAIFGLSSGYTLSLYRRN